MTVTARWEDKLCRTEASVGVAALVGVDDPWLKRVVSSRCLIEVGYTCTTYIFVILGLPATTTRHEEILVSVSIQISKIRNLESFI